MALALATLFGALGGALAKLVAGAGGPYESALEIHPLVRPSIARATPAVWKVVFMAILKVRFM